MAKVKLTLTLNPDPASIDALEQLELSLRRMATAFVEAADGAHDAVCAMQLMRGDEYLDARTDDEHRHTFGDNPHTPSFGFCSSCNTSRVNRHLYPCS